MLPILIGNRHKKMFMYLLYKIQDHKPNTFMYLPILDNILGDSFLTLNVLTTVIFILFKSDDL